MADTRRLLSTLQALLGDNTAAAIGPQDVRDFLVSCAPPFGSIYVSTEIETVIAAQNTWTKTLGTTTSRHLKEFDMPSDGRLRYTGSPDVHIHLAVSVSFEEASNNQDIGFRIAKTGDVADADSVASEVTRKIGTAGDHGSVAVHFDTVMSTNDYLELWIQNETSAGNLTTDLVYMFAVGMLI